VGSRKAALPLTRAWIGRAALVLWALALPTGAGAQYPSELFTCVPWLPSCSNPKGPLIIPDCSEDPPPLFETYYGRIAWYPLRCAGPITIAVLSFS